MIDRNAMALYVKVVENQSFSKTAKREKVPLSTVSRKISELEKTLKVRLLERSTRQLRTTEIGQEYYERCRRGLEELEAANLLANNCSNEISGTIQVSAPPNLTEAVITPLITGFRTQYPNIVFRVLVTDQDVHLIEDGIDLAIRMGELNNNNLVARQLLRCRHILVASPKYLDQNNPLVHLEDLKDHQLIAFGTWYDEPTCWTFTKKENVEKISIKPWLSINDFNSVQRAVLDGYGIGKIPSIVCGKLIQEGQLIEVLPSWHLEQITCSAVYSSRINLPRIVELFKDYCVQHIETLVYS